MFNQILLPSNQNIQQTEPDPNAHRQLPNELLFEIPIQIPEHHKPMVFAPVVPVHCNRVWACRTEQIDQGQGL
jgi:hypothetical protein